VFFMARKAIDPTHEELKQVLQAMLDRDEDITARGVVRLHPSLNNASDITRHEARKSLLDEAIQKQQEIRRLAATVKKSGTTVAAEKLQALEARIQELEANEAARIASHLAMIQSVAELGGTAKLLKFYEAYSSIRDQLVKQGALPSSLGKEVIPIRK
jgi:polyhydroxyalkanoate synthesis regulator phasin